MGIVFINRGFSLDVTQTYYQLAHAADVVAYWRLFARI
jgi:hypothetical protein